MPAGLTHHFLPEILGPQEETEGSFLCLQGAAWLCRIQAAQGGQPPEHTCSSPRGREGQWFPARSLADGLSAGGWFVGWEMAPELRPLEESGSAAPPAGPVLGRPLAAGERLAGSTHTGPAVESPIASWPQNRVVLNTEMILWAEPLSTRQND